MKDLERGGYFSRKNEDVREIFFFNVNRFFQIIKAKHSIFLILIFKFKF